jgi:catechol 1,2-dioxygenase/hydroxyquinol 1,2-dioxygenase
MRAIDHNTITDAALDQMAGTTDPRLKQIMEGLVRHLHEFAREVDLTPEEWLEGIKFLTAVGQKCTPFRQEFILLSDTLGFSSLINALHDRRATEDGTKTSLLGPFYRQDSPKMKLGDCIVAQPGHEAVLYGRVTDVNGKGIPNASVEVWQTDEEGGYDLQKDPGKPGEAPPMDMRGHFFTDAGGNYYLRTVLPKGYPIPMDGPVGAMITAQKRHGYRPGHIHFLVGAPGYRELVTALYFEGDPILDTDTVFGVTDSLVVKAQQGDPNAPIKGLPSIHYDFSLAGAAKDVMGRVGADPSQITKAGA